MKNNLFPNYEKELKKLFRWYKWRHPKAFRSSFLKIAELNCIGYLHLKAESKLVKDIIDAYLDDTTLGLFGKRIMCLNFERLENNIRSMADDTLLAIATYKSCGVKTKMYETLLRNVEKGEK